MENKKINSVELNVLTNVLERKAFIEGQISILELFKNMSKNREKESVYIFHITSVKRFCNKEIKKLHKKLENNTEFILNKLLKKK